LPGILFEDQFERLVVPIFLHSGLLHLAMNVMAQFTIGLQAEFKWGMETGSLRPHTL
jgi:membrane associated rhomboid family serine protease